MNKLKYNTHYAQWLNKMKWQFFCTFSTKYSMSMKSARRAMERLHSHLSNYYGKVTLFWVAEPFDTLYGFHTHALIYVENPLVKSLKGLIMNAWQIVSNGKGGKANNHTVLKPYDKKLGANHYVAKYMFTKNADYDLFIPSNNGISNK